MKVSVIVRVSLFMPVNKREADYQIQYFSVFFLLFFCQIADKLKCSGSGKYKAAENANKVKF